MFMIVQQAKVGTREFLLPKCAPPGHTNRALAAHDHTIRRQMYISDKRKKKAQISPGQGLKESSGSILGSDEDSGNVAVEYSSAKNNSFNSLSFTLQNYM